MKKEGRSIFQLGDMNVVDDPKTVVDDDPKTKAAPSTLQKQATWRNERENKEDQRQIALLRKQLRNALLPEPGPRHLGLGGAALGDPLANGAVGAELALEQRGERRCVDPCGPNRPQTFRLWASQA